MARGVDMTQHTKRVVLAVVGMLAVLGVVASASAFGESDCLRRGSTSGFVLDGYYRDSKSSQAQLSFLEDDVCRWQLADKDGKTTDGTFKATGDPNVFLLSDDSGKEFGTVHLAYVSRTGDRGTLFLIVGDDTVQYDKRSRVPAFFGDSQGGQDS